MKIVKYLISSSIWVDGGRMAGRSNVKLARQVWSRMFEFLMRTAPERNRSLGRRGLTPNDARALSSLDRVTGRSMRELAEQWECDASNATWIVDRLERFGLAERRPVPGDRRVRQVVLTPAGERLRAELLEEFHTPPTDLLRLSRKDLEALARLLDQL
ncbi:MAG TPA: MarR family transcriptional regulator [Gemmatimonadales bacterium]|nr:MarR family transcriptional regulator [Gemmatimonadales bacterium]